MSMADIQSSRIDILLGYVANFGYIFLRSISSAAVQALGGAIHDFELSAARGLLQGPLYFIIGSSLGIDFSIDRKHVPAIIYLGLLSVIYNISYYSSTVHLPLVQTAGIRQVFAMLSALLHSKIIFHKEICMFHVISLIICSLGILLVIQPQFLFSDNYYLSETQNSGQNQSLSSPNMSATIAEYTVQSSVCSEQITGYFLAIIAGIVFGMTLDINAIVLHEVKPFVKITYFTSVSFVVTVVITFYVEPIVIKLSTDQVLLVVTQALGTAASCFCHIYGTHMIGGVRSSIISSLNILVILMVQYAFMKSFHPGHRNWIEVVGALIIVVGAAIVPAIDILQEMRKSKGLP